MSSTQKALCTIPFDFMIPVMQRGFSRTIPCYVFSATYHELFHKCFVLLCSWKQLQYAVLYESEMNMKKALYDNELYPSCILWL